MRCPGSGQWSGQRGSGDRSGVGQWGWSVATDEGRRVDYLGTCCGEDSQEDNGEDEFVHFVEFGELFACLSQTGTLVTLTLPLLYLKMYLRQVMCD